MLSLFLLPIFVTLCVRASSTTLTAISVFYFCLVGLCMQLIAFSIVNAVFATTANGEGKEWFGLFACMSACGAIVLSFVMILIRWWHTPEIASERIASMSAILLISTVATLWSVSWFPQLNWWCKSEQSNRPHHQMRSESNKDYPNNSRTAFPLPSSVA